MKWLMRAISTTVIVCMIAMLSSTVFADRSGDEEILAVDVKDSTAKATILVELSTGQVISEFNAHEKLPMASVTKIMSLVLIMEAIEKGDMSMSETITASEYACSMGGSQIWLEPNEQMTVEELLRAVVIGSANDACVALGERVAGTEEIFVQRMNERAAELGMSNTSYKNSIGFDDDGHYTTAYDISIVSRELMKYEKIHPYMITWMDELRGGETSLVNTNQLVRFYDGIKGIKTGYTNLAGSCISACAERDGVGMIAVVLGCETSKERFAVARGLLETGFAGYELFVPSIDSESLKPVKVLKGEVNKVEIKIESLSNVVIPRGKGEAVEYTITLADNVQAPVEAGQSLGKLQITLEGKKIHESNIIAVEGIKKMTVPKGFWILIKSMFQM